MVMVPAIARRYDHNSGRIPAIRAVMVMMMVVMVELSKLHIFVC